MLVRFIVGVALVSVTSHRAAAQTTVGLSFPPGPTHPNGAAMWPALSADGRVVVFTSTSSNLVAGDTNGCEDIFLHDRQVSAIELISRNNLGQFGNGECQYSAISADGRVVAFGSSATNLVPGDTNGFADIFVRDRAAETIERVSVDSSGIAANGECRAPSLSTDGRYVAFESNATNLAPGFSVGYTRVYVRDRALGTIEHVGLGGISRSASISADGRYVAFEDAGQGQGPTSIWVRDRQTGTVVPASELNGLAMDRSHGPSISADGRRVAFWTETDVLPGDTNGHADVFVRDLQAGTVMASVGVSGTPSDQGSGRPSLSPDGRYVSFWSSASNLVWFDSNGVADVFVRDLQAGSTETASLAFDGAEASGGCFFSSIAAGGTWVAFESGANNLIPGSWFYISEVYARSRLPNVRAFCFGDGTGAPCPCGNSGAAGRGCQNSASTGGAVLTAAGAVSVAGDTLIFTSTGELPTALSIFLQGRAEISPTIYGDGVRCVGDTLKRLYVKTAAGGIARAPEGPDPSVSSRSAAAGDAFPAGASRYYQTYYRDANAAFCPQPPGNTWNVSNGIAVVWTY